jgi:uncharacterized protein YndB with AHSA1/START domain
MKEPENSVVLNVEKREVVITRVFDAPCELVWKAWTNPEHFKRWWGPKGFTSPVCRMDVRVGEKYLWCMHGPDGKDYWTTGVFREVVPFKRLVYSDNFSDDKGNVVPPSSYGMTGDWLPETIVTVLFENIGDKTKMTLRHKGMPSGTMSEMAGQGWNQSFDKLDATFH